MFIFTIYDKKACTHTSPFFAINHETAIRSFYRVAHDSRSDINMFPDDFALYCVGEFDSNNGIVSPLKIIEHVVDAYALIKVDKNSES